MFRPHFDEKLAEIRDEVVQMGSLATEMIRLAVDAALNGDLQVSAKVAQLDDDVDRLEKEVVQKSVLTVGMESPVASDLRLLVATLGIAGEIEKVADDAVKLARRATKLSGHFPGEMKLALMQLGEQARKAFSTSMRVYVEYDAALADAVIRSDEGIDGSYVHSRNRVLELIQANPSETEHLVRTIDAFHALEHVADHAVEIVRRLRLHYEGR